jgi:hypothetical protein
MSDEQEYAITQDDLIHRLQRCVESLRAELRPHKAIASYRAFRAISDGANRGDRPGMDRLLAEWEERYDEETKAMMEGEIE